MKQRLFYFINGLLADPAEHVNAWHERAERWVESKGKGVAGQHAYAMLPGENWKVAHVVDDLYQVIKERQRLEEIDGPYYEQELHLVGHSMGARILCELLTKSPDVVCAHLHLIAGACETSFDKNGLNKILSRSAQDNSIPPQIGRITCYVSQNDSVLKAAWFTRWIPFLSYGSMGWKQHADEQKDRASRKMSSAANMISEIIDCTPLDHGTYFEDPHFDRLMHQITQ